MKFWTLIIFFGLMAGELQAQTSVNVVTDYGAVGDAVQFSANTVSNSVIVTTTNATFISAAIGNAVEIFGCGPQTYGRNSYGATTNGYQDLICHVTNIVNGTNLYLDQIPQQTLTNAFAYCGHDNHTNFQNAIDAASGTNTIINIPTGKFLMLSTNRPDELPNNDPTAWSAVNLQKGGLHFIGEGTNNTFLIAQSAWFNFLWVGNNLAKRGFIFIETPPISNDYPVSIENMTLDGGLTNGWTPNLPRPQPANTVDGNGWDGSHGAFDERGFTGHVFTQLLMTNLLFSHWRGEVVKSNAAATNGNLTMVNCTFEDGNASALNIYNSQVVTNCIFSDLFLVFEYYMNFSTNTSYFVNNVVTNIYGGGLSFNGANGRNPPYIVRGNRIFGVVGNGIVTTPGDNITIDSNYFLNVTYPVVIGAAGYQGTFCNSNITVSSNLFLNANTLFQFGGGAIEPYPGVSGSNSLVSMSIFGNTSSNCIHDFIAQNGWATNVNFSSNTVMALPTDGVNSGSNSATISLNTRGSQFAYIATNNLFWAIKYILSANGTNQLSYFNGSRFQIVSKYYPGSRYVLTTTNASQIPAGAQILIWNKAIENGSGTNITVSLASDMVNNVTVTNGTVMAFNYAPESVSWTNAPVSLPPTTYHLTVSNGSGTGDYGPGIPVPIIGSTGYGYWTPSANIDNMNAVIATYTMQSADATVTWVDTTPPPGGVIISGFIHAGSITLTQ